MVAVRSTSAIVVFAIATALICGLVAMILAGTLLPRSVGLAGGALVLWYGLLGLVGGLIMSLVVQRWISSRQLWRLSAGFGAIVVGALLWAYFTARADAQSHGATPVVPTKDNATVVTPEPASVVTPELASPAAQPLEEIGIGMAQINAHPTVPLYFLSGPDIYTNATRIDSITFKEGPHYTDIATAPPWLVPEVLKPDYQLFYFRVVSRTRHAFQVVVNNQTGQTGWIGAETCTFMDWPSFLIGIHSVEPLDPAANPLRVRPLDHAGLAHGFPDEVILHPVEVRASWVKVEVSTFDYDKLGTAWLKWQEGGRLMVSYSLLS